LAFTNDSELKNVTTGMLEQDKQSHGYGPPQVKQLESHFMQNLPVELVAA